MINKFIKLINKKSRFEKLEIKISGNNKKHYKLFLIYAVSFLITCFSIYLTIPKLFDYEKREKNIKLLLLNNFNIEAIDKIDVTYKVFPTPRLRIADVDISYGRDIAKSKVKKMDIILKFSNIYGHSIYQTNKIIISNSVLSVKLKNLKKFYYLIKRLNKKIVINNSVLSLSDSSKNILKIDKFKLENKKLNKIYLEGYFLDKLIKISSFKIKKGDRVKIKIPKIGANINIEINNKNHNKFYIGNVKASLLLTKIRFDFKKSNELKIFNSYIRNDIFRTSFDGIIKTQPSFLFDLNIDADIVNYKKLKELSNKYQKYKSWNNFKINKKINGTLKITLDSIKLKFLNKLKLNLVFANGKIDIKNAFLYSKNLNMNLNGSIDTHGEFKNFDFVFLIDLINKKNVLKDLNIKNKSVSINQIKIDAILNILSNKIYFNDIWLNKKNKLSSKKKSFYKEKFEQIVINENFLGIVDYKKTKDFFEEILN